MTNEEIGKQMLGIKDDMDRINMCIKLLTNQDARHDDRIYVLKGNLNLVMNIYESLLYATNLELRPR